MSDTIIREGRNLILEADKDATGVGDIILRSAGVERGRMTSGGVGKGALAAARGDIQRLARGVTAENFDLGQAVGTSIMIGGTAYAQLIGLRGGDVVTNVFVGCSAAGTATTLFKAGIYSLDGATLYASSASQHALFGTNGVKTIPMTAAWTVPADGGYMVVYVATAGTTLPTLFRGNTGGVETIIGTNARPFATAGTALSDLPAVTVTYAVSGSPINYWVATA